MACGSTHTERRTDAAVEGIDISRYQAQVDWQAVLAADFDFAYIKASEGEMHLDPMFYENWASAKTAGVVRGAYHFFRANLDPTLQADNFTKHAELLPGDLPPVLDVETLDGASRTELITRMRTWLYLTEIRTGARPIIYTNLSFYYRHLAGHFDDYKFWIARYGDRKPSLAAGTDIQFWQYGDRGRVDGISGLVDLNVFFGNRKEFDALRIQEPPILISGDVPVSQLSSTRL